MKMTEKEQREVEAIFGGYPMPSNPHQDEMAKRHKTYCSQNNWDCETCSLVNYSLDCHNNPIHPTIAEIDGDCKL